MIEDVALDALVLYPRSAARKTVNLDRQAFGVRRQRAHHAGHVLVDVGTLLQVGESIRAKRTDIGETAQIGHHGAVSAQLRVGLCHAGALFFEVDVQQSQVLQPRDGFVVDEIDALCIQPQAALDTPPARFLHAAPVLEAFADQPVRRYGGESFVPVLHLDGVQRDVDDIAVGTDLRHFDPVADPQHIVGGELHAGDKRKQGVPKYQQQHRRHGAQTGQQDQRRSVDKYRDDADGGQREDDQLADLYVAFDRARAVAGSACVDDL